MKFKYFIQNNNYNYYNISNYKFDLFFFKKVFVKSRKQMTKVNFDKKNFDIGLVHKFFCISMKSGNKYTLFKNFEKFYIKYIDSIYYEKNLDDSDPLKGDEFYLKYMYYNIIKVLIKKKSFFLNFNKLLLLVLPAYESLFSIKIKKLNKKLRLKYKKKYINTVNYIRPEKRSNLTLKFLNIQSFSVKNYKLYDRLFKVFLTLILHPSKTLA